MSAKNVANSKLRMSSAMPTSRNCCCSTAASSRVDSSVEVFIVMWKRTPLRRAIAGIVEHLARACRIVRISRDIGIVGPVLRRQHAVGGPRLVAQQIMNDGLHVDGVRDGPPHAHILQDGIAQIHARGRRRSFPAIASP